MRTDITWEELEPIVNQLLDLVGEPGADLSTVSAVAIYPNTLTLTIGGGMNHPARLITYAVEREGGSVPF